MIQIDERYDIVTNKNRITDCADQLTKQKSFNGLQVYMSQFCA